ncbi:TonB-dependent siderophore receptor [Acidovorax sp. Root219]|uniref:TonB-dependent receptor n=1 Tax=Acidovorax sp. Root219 TaxID=1736493 RepID=UPI00070F2048|nr:TonB-dependent siderophore receptor [Acidovorax sp. Root219]KRC34362.1 TonB-dependent receptor [Acidovorax sp. Root219]
MNATIKALTWSVAAATSHMALAQGQAQPGSTLPPVVVRESAVPEILRAGNLATGSAASTMDTPFSASSLPVDVLRAQGATTLQEALRNIPGVQADSGFNGSHNQFFTLRGAIMDSATGSSRILRDGVRLSNYPFASAFVESIDVLRGPGAALGVRSEPGGTVNLVTKQPRLANFGSAGASIGTSGALELSADINRVLSQEQELAARLVLTKSDSSEWRHVPDKLEGLKLGIAKSDGNRYHLRAGAEVINQRYQPDYGIPSLGDRPVNVPRDRQFGEPGMDSTTNTRIVDLHGDVALSADTRLNVDLTHLWADSTSVKSFLNGNPLAVTPATPSGTFARGAAVEPGTDRRIDSAALSLTSRQATGAAKHQLFFGLDYYRETLDQPSLLVPASASPTINVFNPVFGQVNIPAWNSLAAGGLTTQNLRSVAASVQDTIELGAWTFVAGLRYTRQQLLYGAAGARAVEESVLSPKLGVLRRLSDSDSLYANWAKGMAPNQVSSSTNQSLPSRRSRQLEVGWKSLWQGGRLTSDLALFQLDQRNMISADQSTPLNNFDFTVDGTGRSRGLEASLTGEVSQRMTLRAAYAYTRAQVLSNSLLAGKTAPNVAPHALSLWGEYQWDIASDAKWVTGAGVYVQSARYADRANTVTLPGYARLDLTQTWKKPLGGGQSVEVQLAVRNLTDKAYYVSSHLHVARWVTPAQGRNVQLSTLYRF